jgi:hypothetical protein
MLKVQTTWRIQVAAPELHHGFTMQGQPWQLGHGLGHLLGNSRTCGGRRFPPGASPSCRRLSDEWMDRSPFLWRPRGCIYALGEPWGVLHLALHEIFLGREENLVSIKSVLSILFCFVALPSNAIPPTSRLQIMQIRYPGCMARNCLQLWYSLFSLETKIRSPNQPWKIICSDFRLTAQQGFRGPYLLAPLS